MRFILLLFIISLPAWAQPTESTSDFNVAREWCGGHEPKDRPRGVYTFCWCRKTSMGFSFHTAQTNCRTIIPDLRPKPVKVAAKIEQVSDERKVETPEDTPTLEIEAFSPTISSSIVVDPISCMATPPTFDKPLAQLTLLIEEIKQTSIKKNSSFPTLKIGEISVPAQQVDINCDDKDFTCFKIYANKNLKMFKAQKAKALSKGQTFEIHYYSIQSTAFRARDRVAYMKLIFGEELKEEQIIYVTDLHPKYISELYFVEKRGQKKRP